MPRRSGSSKARKGRKSGGLSKRQVTTVRREAKKVLASTAETKVKGAQLIATPSGGAQALFHNKVFYLSGLLDTKQGVEDPNDYSSASMRIGDELQLTGLSVRWMMSAFRPNVTYKVAMFWYETGVTLADAIVYFTQGNKLLDRYNTEQISIIDQKIVAPNIGALPADDENPRRTRLVNLNGRWKMKRIKYNEGGTTPKFKNIGVIAVAYDSINTLQTDQVAECVYDYKCFFKDI